MSETEPKRQAAMCYEIRLKGQLSEQWAEWFNGMALGRDAEGNTTLTGYMVDQAALYGVLDQVRDIGLPLVSVRLLSE